MPVSLNTLIEGCRDILKDGESPQALEAVRGLVRQALSDQVFLDEVLLNRPDQPERAVLYEDPDLGFCICAHVYGTAKPGEPHDHGPTWAIYGQAEGETEMTDWRIMRPATDTEPAQVRESLRYTLKPGDAHIYPTGAVHAPLRHGATRLLRIEGKNTDRITRTPIIPI